MRHGRRLTAAIIFAIASAGCVPTSSMRSQLGANPTVPILLNQDFLTAVWQHPDAFPEPAIEPRRVPLDGLSFDDPGSVLEGVLNAADSMAVVYPSERYFYYKFPLAHRIVSGNLRFVDIERGVLHMGYFDDLAPFDMRTATFAAPELEIVAISEAAYRLTFRDRSVTFTLDRSAFEAPALALAPGEELVSGILDESGFYLLLLYHPVERGFYYVLNESMTLPDVLEPVPHDARFWIGRRSRFLFFRDEDWNRHILVGVRSDSVRANDYFDGPFDQVPPRLPLKSRLEAAYPYVKYRGGIDDHGVFRELEGQRVAISPYLAYDTLEQAITKLAPFANSKELNGPGRWAALTEEPKRHFDPGRPAVRTLGQELAAVRQPGQLARTPIFVRQGWPANHYASSSYSWPTDHQAEMSRLWPANRLPDSATEPAQ